MFQLKDNGMMQLKSLPVKHYANCDSISIEGCKCNCDRVGCANQLQQVSFSEVPAKSSDFQPVKRRGICEFRLVPKMARERQEKIETQKMVGIFHLAEEMPFLRNTIRGESPTAKRIVICKFVRISQLFGASGRARCLPSVGSRFVNNSPMLQPMCHDNPITI